MTPEQKQLRIEQILEHQKRRSYALFQNGRSPMSDDTYAETDFLLSLVKSQEAERDPEIERVAIAGIHEGLRQRDEMTAASMRSACVEKVREYLTDCRDEERGIIEAIAGELETFFAEKPKEQE